MSVKIEATGKTITEALAMFGANLETATTDDLLIELRQRFAEYGQVVKIVPFADGAGCVRKAA